MFHFSVLEILSAQPAEGVGMPICANIKSRKFPQERCKYKASKGDYCSRHYKHPRRFELHGIIPVTRSTVSYIKKIQHWWRLWHGLKLSKLRTPAFFIRTLCHNETELASFGPLNEIPHDYFFVVNDNGRFWGFDIRTLVIQYESHGYLENPYTKTQWGSNIVGDFRIRVDTLRRWKKSIQYEETGSLTLKQSWNLRVLDLCLRLDMLGYRVATQWFTDLDIVLQRHLYTVLFDMWNEQLNLTPLQREQIVPHHSIAATKLFKWTPTKVVMTADLDSVRRTNLNVMERLITSAEAQSDRTLGAMYTVMGLCQVSGICRRAYPWLYG